MSHELPTPRASLSELLALSWWVAAGRRAARSFLVALVPFIPGIVAGNTSVMLAAGSTGALLAVLSLATSWRSLPEIDDVARPWWAATLDRVVRTFGQGLLANIPAVVLIQDVPWPAVLTNAAAQAAGSFVLAIIAALPETQPVSVPADKVVQAVSVHGRIVAGPASPLPTGSIIAQPLSELDD